MKAAQRHSAERGQPKNQRTPVIEFLMKLWADKAVELVEEANRDAHGGMLTVPTAAIDERHYRQASERLRDETAALKPVVIRRDEAVLPEHSSRAAKRPKQ